MTELPPHMLARFTLIDYDREMALVAMVMERKPDDAGRDTPRPSASSACRATSPTRTRPPASSRWWWPTTSSRPGPGLAPDAASWTWRASKGLARSIGLVLANNDGMLKLMRSLGFAVKPYAGRPGLPAGDAELVVLALAGQALDADVVVLVLDTRDVTAGHVQQAGRMDLVVFAELFDDVDGHFQVHGDTFEGKK
jgi:hypothetical protein